MPRGLKFCANHFSKTLILQDFTKMICTKSLAAIYINIK